MALCCELMWLWLLGLAHRRRAYQFAGAHTLQTRWHANARNPIVNYTAVLFNTLVRRVLCGSGACCGRVCLHASTKARGQVIAR